jgi:hypothetical protein
MQRAGQYVVTWISSSRWKEELEIANYKRLRVHTSKGYWQQSTLSFQPETRRERNVFCVLTRLTAICLASKTQRPRIRTRRTFRGLSIARLISLARSAFPMKCRPAMIGPFSSRQRSRMCHQSRTSIPDYLSLRETRSFGQSGTTCRMRRCGAGKPSSADISD